MKGSDVTELCFVKCIKDIKLKKKQQYSATTQITFVLKVRPGFPVPDFQRMPLTGQWLIIATTWLEISAAPEHPGTPRC